MSKRNKLERITNLDLYDYYVDREPDEADRVKVLEMIRFFEDKRVLYHPFRLEAPPWITDAVIVVRNKITEMLECFDTKSPTTIILLTMRGACRKYLETTSGFDRKTYMRDIIIPIIQLRTVFGLCIGKLAILYLIDVDNDLAKLIPVAEDDGKDIVWY